MAATRTLPPCRLSAGLVPVRLRQYHTYERISPQPPLVEPIEHLKKRDNCNVEQKGAPLPPKSGSITFFIFYEGGKGGCPAAGGKGEHFCVPAVLSCDRNATDFSFTENSWRAGKTGGVQRASLYNDCFSRKQAGHKAEGAASCFASLPFCPPFLKRLT